MSASSEFCCASTASRRRKRMSADLAPSLIPRSLAAVIAAEHVAAVITPAAAEGLPFTHDGVKIVKRKIDRLQAHATGSFALTLSPKSWFDILFALFGSTPPSDRGACTYIDVGCGQGHGVVYAHQLCGVHSDGVDFDEVISVAQMTWKALIKRGDVAIDSEQFRSSLDHWSEEASAPQLRFSVGDALSSRFTLAPYTHASCIIDDAGVVLRFIALAQATTKGSKRRRRRVERIVFLVPNRGMQDLSEFGFKDYRQFKVTLEGGRCSRSVCYATL